MSGLTRDLGRMVLQGTIVKASGERYLVDCGWRSAVCDIDPPLARRSVVFAAGEAVEIEIHPTLPRTGRITNRVDAP